MRLRKSRPTTRCEMPANILNSKETKAAFHFVPALKYSNREFN